MTAEDSELAREWVFFANSVDPLVHQLLDVVDPWDAYDIALTISGTLSAEMMWLPDGGAAYVAWAELADVYETGRTPDADAHAALRRAASDWLGRPPVPSETFVGAWVERARNTSTVLFRRDGDWWTSAP